MNIITRSGLMLLCLVAALTAFAADWNQWRGPDCSGIQPDGPKLMDSWKKGPATVWGSEPASSSYFSGHGSPVIANGKVYQYINLSDNPGGSAHDVILCLNANDGTTVWKAVFPGKDFTDGPFIHWCGSLGYGSTPAVANGKVYVVGGNGFYCLDADTGKTIWIKTGVQVIEDRMTGLSSSPTVVGNVVVVGSPLRGYDATTGRQLWECAIKGGSPEASPVQWKCGDRTYIIANLGKLCAIDPENGAILWVKDFVWGWDSNETPTINGDYCVIGDPVAVYKLSPTGATKVFSTELSDRGASQIIYDQHVYSYTDGTVCCLDFTGKVLWEQSVGGEVSSIVEADSKGFVISGDGTLWMWALTPDAKPTFYKASIPVCAYTTPAIEDGKLYAFLRGGKGVGCFDLTSEPVPKPGEIDRTTWVCTAIVGPNPENVVNDFGKRWTTDRAMKAGDWLQIDMLQTYKLTQVTLDSSAGPNDAAQGVQLWLSTDGVNFSKISEYSADQMKPMHGLVKFDLPSTEARYIKFVNMGSNGFSWWSVYNVGTTFDTTK